MDADQTDMRRFLCSEIVKLNIAGHEYFVNLEEIWRTGAVLEAEETAPAAETGELRAGAVALNLSIKRIEKHEYGYRIEVAFLDTEWTPQLFTPAHMTDLTVIAERMRAHGESGQ